MLTAEQITKKLEAGVELIRIDGTLLNGTVFLRGDQRVIDVVNDERQFLPFVDPEGVFSVINKSTISSIKPVDQNMVRVERIPGYGYLGTFSE